MGHFARSFCALLISLPLSAQGLITTLAGADWVFQGSGRAASAAPLGRVERMCFDRAGNLYVADPENNLVFRIDPAGILTIAAGTGQRDFSGDNGPATAAALSQPAGVRADAAGNLYIADAGNLRIRKVSPSGRIATIGGNGSYAFNGDGIPATSASFRSITDIALDSTGNLYFGDFNRVRKITAATGIISTIAGAEDGGFSGDGGPATAARLEFPGGIFVDSRNQIYIADSFRVRRIDTAGIIRTVAGNGDYVGLDDGAPATAVSIRNMASLAVDDAGVLFIADTGHSRIVRVGLDGVLTTIAGTGNRGFAGDGGPGRSAQLSYPAGIAIDSQGNVFIADTGNRRIRRVSSAGVIGPFAGNGTYRFGGDGGPAAAGLFNQPSDLTFDKSGNLFVADRENHRVRRIGATGISTVAGDGIARSAGDGGRAAAASLDSPCGLAFDPTGNMYIGEAGSNRVRKVDLNGIISVFAGGGSDLAAGTAARLRLASPCSLTFDRSGNLYVGDTDTFLIHRITPTGAVSRFAGNNQYGQTGDGGAATSASLGYISAIAFDSKGNLFVSERYPGRVRRISTSGIIATVAGNGKTCCSGDGGLALQAAIDAQGLTFDASDNLYLGGSDRIRKIAADGTITTIAGSGGDDIQGLGDGGSALTAPLRDVTAVRADADGNLYFVDSGHNRVRQVLSVAPPFDIVPDRLSFAAKSGGAPPVPQSLLVTSKVTNLSYTVTASKSDGNWLQVVPDSGLAPGIIDVSATPQSLPPGEYEGTISIQAAKALPPLRVVNVRFSVAPADAPKLVAEPGDLAFDFVTGLPGQTATLLVRNNGSGTINFKAAVSTTNGGNWLTISPAAGSATAATPASITVAAAPGTLPPGTYSGLISIQGDVPSQRALMPVVMAVHGSAQSIVLSSQGLTINALAGSTPQRATFEVLNAGLGNLDWNAVAQVLPSGGDWLSVRPSSGASGPSRGTAPQVEVTADPSNLAPGGYYGRVLITSPGAVNSPQTVSVVLSVGAIGAAAEPDVRPTGLVFVGFAGAPAASQDVIVNNTGGTSTAFRSSRSADVGSVFFTHQPTDATVNSNQPLRLSVQPLLTGLPPGVRRGRITLQFTDSTTRVVEILLVIPPTASSGPEKARLADACAPSSLNLVFSALGQQFQVPASWPVPVEVKVIDNCGVFLDAGFVSVSFSNGDPPLALTAVGTGRWRGTWQPGLIIPQVRVTAVAENATRALRGTTQASGSVNPNPDVPVIANGSVVNAASLSARTPIAPGGLISIFGLNLSSGVAESTVPRGSLLNGTLVIIAGVAAPLLYVSESQVNALVPFSVPVNSVQQMIIQSRNSLTLPISVTIAPAQPAVFTANSSGVGQGTVYGPSNRLADAANPVAAGDVVVIYCAGLGAVDQPVSDGFPAPSSPLARTKDPVTVTIGGKPATVLYSGLAPGFTGLYQVNAIVPDGIANPAASLVLTTVGQESPAVTIAVK